jgi:uncharacterized membrane protein
MEYSDVFVFGGIYGDPEAAKTDFERLSQMHKDGTIGPFQAAVFEKQPDGKVKVLNTTSTTRTTGAKWGAGIGAVLGIVFPPSILMGAAGGAAIGALAGNLSKGWFKGDVKRLADELAPGQAGVIAVAEATEALEAEAVLAGSQKTQKEHITGADADKVKEQLRSEETVGAAH